MSTRARGFTAQLLFAVLISSFGTWFPFGLLLGTTNTAQFLILNWIRSVRCSRLTIGYGMSRSNDTEIVELWCRDIPAAEETFMLKWNTELNTLWALCGSVPIIGSILGLLVVDAIVKRFGNKNTLLITNILAVIGTFVTALCVMANSHEMFIVGRFLLGLHNGLTISIIPVYIAEISPVHLRGLLGSVPNLMFALGLVTACALGIKEVFGTTDTWTVITWLRMIPVIALYIGLPFCPESPRNLLMTKRDKPAAQASLKWLRGTSDVGEELDLMQQESEKVADEKTASIIDIAKDPFLRKVLFVCLMGMVASQGIGYTGVMMYSTSILLSAGLDRDMAVYCSVGMLCLPIIASFISASLIDRLGRKLLFLGGLIASVLCNVGLVTFMALDKQGFVWASTATMVVLMAYVVIFNLGPSTVPFVLPSEMFPQTARGAAMTFAVQACYVPAVAVSFLFPILAAVIEEWVFLAFAVFTVIMIVYLYFNLMETKGKTFEEIQAELRRKFGFSD